MLGTLLNEVDQTIIELPRRQRAGNEPLYPHTQQRCFGLVIRNNKVPAIQGEKFDEGDRRGSFVAIGKRVVVRKRCTQMNPQH